jgi:hypothetical protein
MITTALRPMFAAAGGYATGAIVESGRAEVRKTYESVFSVPEPDLLTQCYWYNERRQIDQAIDAAIDSFDELLRDGRFRAADALLGSIDVDRLDPDVTVAILVFTRAAADRLTNRGRLAQRLSPVLERSEGLDVARRTLEQVR